jgi:hypothetical protein
VKGLARAAATTGVKDRVGWRGILTWWSSVGAVTRLDVGLAHRVDGAIIEAGAGISAS